MAVTAVSSLGSSAESREHIKSRHPRSATHSSIVQLFHPPAAYSRYLTTNLALLHAVSLSQYSIQCFMQSLQPLQLKVIILFKLVPRLIQRRKHSCADHPLLSRSILRDLVGVYFGNGLHVHDFNFVRHD